MSMKKTLPPIPDALQKDFNYPLLRLCREGNVALLAQYISAPRRETPKQLIDERTNVFLYICDHTELFPDAITKAQLLFKAGINLPSLLAEPSEINPWEMSLWAPARKDQLVTLENLQLRAALLKSILAYRINNNADHIYRPPFKIMLEQTKKQNSINDEFNYFALVKKGILQTQNMLVEILIKQSKNPDDKAAQFLKFLADKNHPMADLWTKPLSDIKHDFYQTPQGNTSQIALKFYPFNFPLWG